LDFQPESWAWLLNEENVWLTFGCHPNLSQFYSKSNEDLLWKALFHHKTVALGEIGLVSMLLYLLLTLS
jgi:Tat protein secretion system quality control protein TatD with DNase activity